VLIYSPHVFPIFEFDTMAKGKTNPITEVNHRVWSVYAIFAVRNNAQRTRESRCVIHGARRGFVRAR
jgi:hypothetical protein